MRTFLFFVALLIAFAVSGCAGARKVDSEKGDLVFLTVRNRLQTTADIYWQQPGTRPRFLGRVKAGQRREFALHGPFFAPGIRLIARPVFGQVIVAEVPVTIEVGKKLTWELSRNHFYWTER